MKGLKSRRRNTGRRTLLTIAVLLAVSGLVRLGDLGIAVAEDVNALLTGTSAQVDPVTSCPTEADIEIVLAALQTREARLVENETALASRMTALADADQQIAAKLRELEDAENRLAETIATAKTAASDDLTRLTTLYENMKPKQAIALFEAMEPDFAAGFLSRMKPNSAAQILAGLDPQTAYAISVVFVGRNANVPTN